MARIRSIKPDFFRHEALFEAEQETGFPLRVAFAGMWTVADREGRFRWRPRIIKLDVLPFDVVDFGAVLDALASRGFIVKYEVDGELYGYIPSFLDHQHVNQREAASDLPAPVKDDARTETHVHARGEGKGREQEGEGNGIETAQLTRACAMEDPLPEPERSLPDYDLALPTFLDRSIPPSRKGELDEIERQLREAARLENDPSPGLLDLSPIIGLLDAGYRLTEDVLTVIRAKAKPGVSSWRYFEKAIVQAKAANQAIAPKPAEPATKPVVWVHNEQPEWSAVSERWQREKGKPPPAMGSRNGRVGQGHYFPADWLSAQPERTQA